MARNRKARYPVLLADDSVTDCLLMRLALCKHRRLELVSETHDGVETIAYLNADEHFSNRKHHPFPKLLILDLQMPCKSGYEVLSWLQGQRLTDLLVVVVSGSRLDGDCERTLALGAAAYHVKPVDRGEREAMVGSFVTLLDRWH